METIIGRKDEVLLLKGALRSKEAGLIAVYGRRRVGKTYLIRTYLQNYLAFELTGMYDGRLQDQLMQFGRAMQKATGMTLSFKPPDSWIEAFQALEQYLEAKSSRRKWVVFLDEFPWLDSRRSGFLSAFVHFWNTWASRQPNILVVVCGSSASWMIRNIVNNKGGLHNRITQKIRLLPFTLAETAEYLKSLGSKLNQYQVLQLYMALGGIPHYLKNAQRGKSAAQIIQKTCFDKDGLLTGEFNNLYHSLFEIADNHIKVVRALANHKNGLTRQELIRSCKLSSGGRATLMLEELEESGFIGATLPFDKVTKDAVYRLVDEFSIFYLRFMEVDKGNWQQVSTGNRYTTWSGMAFEAVCLKHISQLKKALGIAAVETRENTWRYIPRKGEKETGAQIDLLIDRKDRCINICEMKFYSEPYTIDKSYARELQHKMDLFVKKTGTRKTLLSTMVTTYGVKKNTYADQMVQNSLEMSVLFE